MSLFKKRQPKQQQIDYLQTTDTVSRPLATVFMILMVIVLSAAVFSIFVGGRWLYEHLDGSNTPTAEVVVNPITETPPVAASTTNNGSSATVTPTNQQSVSVTGTTNATVTTGGASANPATTPATSQPQTIPATGSAETVSLFVITVVVATLGHYYLRRAVR